MKLTIFILRGRLSHRKCQLGRDMGTTEKYQKNIKKITEKHQKDTNNNDKE